MYRQSLLFILHGLADRNAVLEASRVCKTTGHQDLSGHYAFFSFLVNHFPQMICTTVSGSVVTESDLVARLDALRVDTRNSGQFTIAAIDLVSDF